MMIPFIIQSIESPDDRGFMESIYNAYSRLMFSEIKKIVCDEWATEDIMHTVVVKLIDKLQVLQTLSKPKLVKYIVSASRNTAYNYLRDNNKITAVAFDDSVDMIIADTPDFDNLLILREEHSSISAAWEKLDEHNKRLLESKYILAQSNKEIADELGIGTESVRTYLARARNALKEIIKDI